MTIARGLSQMALFSSVLLVAGSLPLAKTFAADYQPKIPCPVLYKDLFEHSEKAMESVLKDTGYFYWGRARVAISATPNEALDRIFSKMSKKDLEELYWAVKSGAVKTAPKEEKMIEELWHMVDDLGEKPFWGDVPDRSYAIREALQAHDAKLSFSGDPAFAAQLTDQALGNTEMEVLGRALAEHDKKQKFPNSKWYDRVVRFFSPHHDKVQAVLSANNSIRRRLQKMFEADKPATDAIARYQGPLNLTKDELKELQGQVSDTAGQLNEARKDIEVLYGREVSTNKPLPAAEIRVRELAKRASSIETKGDEKALREVTESDMDTIDRVVGGAWNRAKKTDTGMPVTEKHDVHLQIRNPQYRRETPQLRAVYQNITEARSPKKAEYDVRTEWTVTVEHAEPKTRIVQKPVYDDKGNQTGTTSEIEHYTDYYSTTYEMERPDVLQARYEEVLDNRVVPSNHISDLPALPTAQTRGAYAVSASNGSPSIGWHDSTRTDWILNEGRNARASETPYRQQIAAATAVVDSVTNETYKAALKTKGEAPKILAELRKQESELRATRAKLSTYGSKDTGSIQSQWTHDKEKDFKDRNNQMLARYDHLINRVVHLAEQVRRETPSLEIEYVLPTYEPQMTRLKEIKDKNRKIIVTTASTATAAAAATGAYVYREEIKTGIKELIGEDDRNRYRDNRGY